MRRIAGGATVLALLALSIGAGAGPARAQATDVMDNYEAGTTGLSVHVELNLPTGIELPVIGAVSSLTVDVSDVDGTTVGDQTGPEDASATADVFESNNVAMSALLDAVAAASLGGDAEAEDSVLAQDLGLVKAGVGVVDAKVTDAGEIQSSSSLASFFLGLSAESALVEFEKATASQRAGLVDGVITALSNASVSDVSVLGDLVTVGAVETTATAETAGSAGSASASIETTVTNLKVADVLDINIGPAGITGSVLGNEIPEGDPAEVLGGINGVLATAGVQIIAGELVEEAAEDGSTAQASSEGLGIIVNPLKAAKPLVSLQFVPAGVAVAADRAALPPDEEPRAPIDPPDDILPKTGGGFPLPAGVALLTAAAAVTLRRRTAATIHTSEL